MQPGRARISGLAVPPLLLGRWVGSVAPVRPTDWPWFVVSPPSAALGAHVSAVSLAPWRLFNGVRAQRVPVCRVGGHLALVHRCARLVCSVCRVLGLSAPAHQCARPVCASCSVLGCFAPVHRCVARRVVLHVGCPWPLGSCAPVCPLCALCVQSPWPLGSCSLVCPLGVLCCACGVLGPLAAVYRCARLVRCVACGMSSATCLLFTGVPARCVVLRVWCPWPLGSCSLGCLLAVLL